jgi:hypothetical protein
LKNRLREHHSNGDAQIDRRHTEIDHRFQFPCVVAVSEHARIAAAGNRHSSGDRSLETGAFAGEIGFIKSDIRSRR